MDMEQLRGAGFEEVAPPSVALPSYESLQSALRPGITNPHYTAGGQGQAERRDDQEREEEEEERGGRREEEEEGDEDDFDLPPPYSPGIRNVYVAPPDYFTIFGQIREAREESRNHLAFLGRVGQIILNTVGCTVLLLVFMSVPITILALGIYFIGDCQTEPHIPIFLIVVGISGAVKNIALVFENIMKRMSHRIPFESARRLRYGKYVWRVINLLFNLFLVAWIIAGSYWIYHIYREVDPEYKDCHETLYKFAFGVITSSYILMVMMCGCMCCCGICLMRSRAEEEEEEEENEEEERGEDEVERCEGENSLRSGTESRTQSNASLSEVTSEYDSQGRETGTPRGDDRVRDSTEGSGERGSAIHSHSDASRENTSSPDRGCGHAGASRPAGRRRVQSNLSLDNLEPLEMVDYECTPIMSPRLRQLAADEQELPLYLRTTSV